MTEFLTSSVYAGVVVSISSYFLGDYLKRKTKLDLMNPLLISVALTIVFLLIFEIPYSNYSAGANILTYLLTPATVCLAVPLYEKLSLLKKNGKAIIGGILAGVITSAVCIFLMSLAFGLNHTAYVTLLPKSITTAIGMGVSEKIGGIPSVTVPVIIITGVFGNIIAPFVCKLFRITDPVAKGVGIGTSAHAVGTSKAFEMGETEGAMSSLAVAVAGLVTVVTSPLFAYLL